LSKEKLIKSDIESLDDFFLLEIGGRINNRDIFLITTVSQT